MKASVAALALAELAAAALHATPSQAVLAVVPLHLAAIAFYAVWKRENLLRPMIDGRKDHAGEP